MGIVQSVGGGTGVSNFTLTGVSSANALVLAVGNSSKQVPPAGFSAFNAPALFIGATNVSAQWFINLSPAGGTNSVTVAANTVGALIEVSGLSVSPIDVTPAGVNTTGITTGGGGSVVTGALSQPSEIIFFMLAGNETGAGSSNIGVTTPSGFTQIYAQNDTTVAIACEVSYQIVSATTSLTVTSTYSDTPIWVTQMTVGSLKLVSLPPGSIYT